MNNIEAIYGLSPMQKGMLFQNRADAGSSSYHVQSVFWMHHDANIESIASALDLLTQKHEALRTSFVIPQASGEPKQVVLNNRSVDFTHAHWPDTLGDEAVEAIMDEDLARPFDLQNDILFRVKMVSFNRKLHLFLFSVHHIIMDGWCLSTLFHDFFELYGKLEEGRSPETLRKEWEAQGNLPYKEYINWLESQDQQEALGYWKALLEDYSGKGGIAPRGKPTTVKQQVGTVKMAVSHQKVSRLLENAKAKGVTLNVMAEAAWGIVLQQYNFTDDVVFGKVVSGRNLPLPHVCDKVGLFINAIPLRFRCKSGDSLGGLIQEIYRQGIQSSAYEYCPLADVQNCSSQGGELIKTIFVFENFDETKVGSAEETYDIRVGPGREQTHYPVSVRFSTENSGLAYTILYDPRLFGRDEIQVLGARVLKALDYLADDLDMTLSDIEIISDYEKNQILNVFNTFGEMKEGSKTIVELFEEQVARVPLKVAVVCRGERVTYAELNEMANSVARRLVELGVKNEDYVAILCHRSICSVACVYGILKAGAAYVPLDPSCPEERMKYILGDCEAKLLISEFPVASIAGTHVTDIRDESLWSHEKENMGLPLRGDHLAYCIYTSGTTGNPKGVMVEHKGVHSLKLYFEEKLGIREEDHILQFANFSFDASTWEMNMALLTGATMVIVTDEERNNSEKFIELTEREHVSVATLPTVFYNHIEGFSPRLLITAGSESSSDIVRKATVESEYINAYGPTETTVAATHWKYCPGDPIPARIPIGKPILNTQTYIMNGNALCGVGMPGELCVAGIGVARGYLKNPVLTQRKFFENPYGKGRIYRTGDLAMWLEDGNIEYLGRIDDQVKIRGFRVELGDIENAFSKLDYIMDAAILTKKDRHGETSLVAYYVADSSPGIEEIREDLSKTIPFYMIPSSIVRIQEMPVTSSGKPDKKKLGQLSVTEERSYEPPRNQCEADMCGLFAQILHLDRIGVYEDFFEQGGNSLTAMKLMSMARGKGYDINIADISRLRTVRRIAEDMARIDRTDEVGVSVSGQTYRCRCLSELRVAVEQAAAAFERQIIISEPGSRHDLSPMQMLSLEQDMLMSGCSLTFGAEFNIAGFEKALKELINCQDQMRCIIFPNGDTPKLAIHDPIETLELPVIDLTGMERKQEAEELLDNLMFKQDRWEKCSLGNRPPYQVIVVQFGAEDWKVYMPFCHLIFDGQSADMLQERLMRLYHAGNNERQRSGASFGTYMEMIDRGPIGVEENEIMQKFGLEEMEERLTALAHADIETLENCFLSIPVTVPLNEMDIESIWNISFELCKSMMAMAFPKEDPPVAVLYAGRKYDGYDFTNTIGEFLDIIPVFGRQGADYSHVNTLTRYMAEHRICFSSFLYHRKLREQFPSIARVFDGVRNSLGYFPTFNFLGYTAHRLDQKKMEEIHKADKTRLVVDVLCSDNAIILNGFCRKGQAETLARVLETALSERLTGVVA